MKLTKLRENFFKFKCAMLWEMDQSVGKVVTALDKNKMLDNTLIVFTTDNGGAADGFNSNAASNWPLRGVKDTLWEGGVRGSACIWSRNLPSSKVNHNLMHIQDWLPTILAAVNSSSLQEENLKLDGHNMWPVLRGEKHHEYNEVVLNIDQLRNMSALRKGDFKIIAGQIYNGRWDGWYGPSGRDSGLTYNLTDVENSLVANAFKRNNITFPNAKTINEVRNNVSVMCKTQSQAKTCNLEQEVCLFNLITDPCERVNLAADHPNILKNLMDTLRNYKPVNPLNRPVDPKSNPKYWNYTWTNWMDYI